MSTFDTIHVTIILIKKENTFHNCISLKCKPVIQTQIYEKLKVLKYLINYK